MAEARSYACLPGHEMSGLLMITRNNTRKVVRKRVRQPAEQVSFVLDRREETVLSN